MCRSSRRLARVGRLSLAPFVAVLLAVGITARQHARAQPKDAPSRPNILLLVADDLGYADLGSYGSDIETPNLDRLASEGLRFSRFHTAPICAPTRAMLLSGNDNHVAGMGSQGRQTDRWGYEGHLTDRIATIPQVLGQAGYHTYMAGKWHLGGKPGQLPPAKGFDRSFVLHQGAANHYNDTFLSSRDSTAEYSTNGTPVGWPEGDYSTKVYTDSLIKYVKENRDSDRPFFAYAAYTSPHWPLQVDRSFWQKYEGRYEEGYQALRKRRLASLKEAGMVPNDAELPPLNPEVEPWDELSAHQKTREARKMALYAGMVDNLDHHIGRLIQVLKDMGEYENTLIVFMSDNGAAGEDFYNHPRNDFLRSRYDNSLENMGRPSSFVSYGPQWAEAGSAPFRYYKGFTYEGGVTAPMIIRAPDMEARGEIYDRFATLTDLAPTFYEMVDVTYPSTYRGSEIETLQGTSLVPALRGDTAPLHAQDEAWVLEHGRSVLVRKGPWKLVNPGKRWEASNFELYNLEAVPSEARDLSQKHPDTFNDLFREWQEYRDEKKLVTPAPDGALTSADYLRQFTGEYAIRGQTFTVRLRAEDPLTLTLPGQPTYTLVPKSEHTFRLEGEPGFSVEFKKESGTVSKLILNHPNGTATAKRK